MLAAIIANLQNVLQPQPRLPTINIDRGGAGPSWPGQIEIVDILEALQTFPEIVGEHPVARAVRRHAHVGRELGKIHERRERREAAAFLVGARVGAAAALEAAKVPDEETIARLIEIIDRVRGAAKPVVPTPSSAGAGVGAGMALALLLGIALLRRL